MDDTALLEPNESRYRRQIEGNVVRRVEDNTVGCHAAEIRRPNPMPRSDPASTACEAPASVSFEAFLSRRSAQLSEMIEARLHENTRDANDHEGINVDVAVEQEFLAFARRLVPYLALAPQLKLAPFVEETGALSLVAQSLITDRRMSAQFLAASSVVAVIRIDESMRAIQEAVDYSNPDMPRRLAEWIVRRS